MKQLKLCLYSCTMHINKSPQYIQIWSTATASHAVAQSSARRGLRSVCSVSIDTTDFHIKPRTTTKFGQGCFCFAGQTAWNRSRDNDTCVTRRGHATSNFPIEGPVNLRSEDNISLFRHIRFRLATRHALQCHAVEQFLV